MIPPFFNYMSVITSINQPIVLTKASDTDFKQVNTYSNATGFTSIESKFIWVNVDGIEKDIETLPFFYLLNILAFIKRSKRPRVPKRHECVQDLDSWIRKVQSLIVLKVAENIKNSTDLNILNNTIDPVSGENVLFCRTLDLIEFCQRLRKKLDSNIISLENFLPYFKLVSLHATLGSRTSKVFLESMEESYGITGLTSVNAVITINTQLELF